MRILVTGGSGFIGTNYINLLLQSNQAEILNVDHRKPGEARQKDFWRNCDILDAPKLNKIFLDFSPTHVVHLAAKLGLDDTDLSLYAANIEGVRNMLAAIKNVPSIERVIFTSTLLVCRIGYIPKSDTDYQPSTLYGKSKMLGEMIVREEKELPFLWTILRPISIWGPWCTGSYRDFFQTVAKKRYFHIGHGHYMKSLGYVENTAYQIHKVLLAPAEKVHGRTIYLGDEPPADLYDLAEISARELGMKKLYHLPLTIAQLAAKTGDVIKKVGWNNVPLTSFRLNNILTDYVFDLSPVMEISGPLPCNLESGIKRTIAWMKNKGEINS